MLNLAHEIALCDARLNDLLGRLPAESFQDTLARLKTAHAMQDNEGIGAAIEELEDLAGRQEIDDETWEKVSEQTALRRKLVEAERRRLVEMHQMVRMDEMIVAITATVDAMHGALLRNLSDGQLTRKIIGEVADAMARLEHIASPPERAAIPAV